MYRVEITNKYEPDSLEVPLGVKKILTGNELPADVDYTFNFTLTTSNGAPLPDPATTSITVNSTSGADDLKAAFGNIHFTAAGTYTYTVTESMADNYTGMSIVDGTKTVTIKIKDNNGTLEIESITGATADGTVYRVEITNRYEPSPVELQIPVKKTLQGVPETETVFTFTLTPVDDAPAPENRTVTITMPGEGTGSFDAINYTAAGTYTYKVTETVGTIPGMSYDTSERTVVVTVTDNNGKLEANITGDLTDGYVQFTNSYNSPEVEVTVTKIWDDGDDQDGIRPESITVTLSASYEKDGTKIAIDLDENLAVVEITPDATGAWTYTWKKLPKYKELNYEISYRVDEVAITYIVDGVEQTAPDGFQTGYTKVVGDLTETAPGVFTVQITNTHIPETTDFQFTKLGVDPKDASSIKPLKGVTFTLYSDENCSEIVATAVSDENGVVKFEKIRFTVTENEGVYSYAPAVYYMKETDQGENDATYWDNDTVYKVTLTPANGSTPASFTIEVEGTALDYTGALASTADGYTITNEPVGYEIKLVKLDHADNTKPIEGAKFDLYSYTAPAAEPDGGETPAASTPPTPHTLPTVADVMSGGTKLNADSLVTGEDGKIDLGDRLPGTYYLVETEAPMEYYKLAEPVELIVAEDEITVNYNIVVIDGENFTNTGVTNSYTVEQGQTAAITVQITDQPKYGSLTITKLLPTYEDSEAATFTFDVVATIDGQIVYSNVVALTISAAGSASETLDHIPAGAHVVVKEINTGAHYECTSGDQETTIEANVTVGVDFTNTYHVEITGGHGIENRFEPDDTELGWHWVDPRPAA